MQVDAERAGPMVKRTCLCTGILLAGCIQPLAWSAEWESNFGIAPEIVFTDNVCLNADDKQSEWIGSLTPSLNFSGVGKRAIVNFAGSLQFHTLDNNNTECDDPQGNRTDSPIPALQFDSQSAIVEDWLFLNASARARQNDLNQFRAAGNNGLNRSANFNTTTQYQLNPYIARRVGGVANFRLGYSYDEQQNSEDIVGDSTVDTVDASLSSVANGTPFSWAVSGYDTKVEFEEQVNDQDDTSELRAVTLQVGYQITSKFQINGSVGEEDNDFPTAVEDTGEDTDGSFWDVGFLYTPSSRLSLAAGTGDRFFGSTPRLDFTYRHRRSVFIAQYSKGLNFTRNIRGIGGTSSQTVEVDDRGGIGFGSQLAGFSAPTGLARAPIIEERFTLGYVYTGRRHSIDLQGRSSQQERTDINQESEFNSVSIRLTRTMGRTRNAYLRLLWDERLAGNAEDVAFANDSETWTGAVGYTWNISEQGSVSLEYLYTDRDSEIEGDTFTENRVIATLNIPF